MKGRQRYIRVVFAHKNFPMPNRKVKPKKLEVVLIIATEHFNSGCLTPPCSLGCLSSRIFFLARSLARDPAFFGCDLSLLLAVYRA